MKIRWILKRKAWKRKKISNKMRKQEDEYIEEKKNLKEHERRAVITWEDEKKINGKVKFEETKKRREED